MPDNSIHPERIELGAYSIGKLNGDREVFVERHLENCTECQDIASQQCDDDQLVELLRSASQSVAIDKLSSAAQHVTHFTNVDSTSILRKVDFKRVPSDAEIKIPSSLADHPRYRIIRPLGRGGMGQVWLAEHLIMGRSVALKMIREELSSNDEMRDRFRRELQSIARMHHPNVATAYDAEQIDRSLFCVMEHIEGKSLSELISTGRLELTQACQIILGAARGLQHAHGLGIIHRDVKPSNIMIAENGTAKLLDFGLASVIESGSSITGLDVLMGTPDYVAPEQAENPHLADRRSDIYSLGCTFYHLLAGTVPFPVESVLKKLDGHRFETPKKIDGLPTLLSTTLERMMAKEPKARYQDIHEFIVALESILSCENAALKGTWCGLLKKEPGSLAGDRMNASKDSFVESASASGSRKKQFALGQPITSQRNVYRRRWLIGGAACNALGLLGASVWLSRNPKPVDSGLERELKQVEIHELTEPTSVSSGTGDSFHIEKDSIDFNTLPFENQTWFNYLTPAAKNLELSCQAIVREVEKSSFLKLVLLEDHRSEYNFQIRCNPKETTFRLERGDVKTGSTKTIWASDPRSGILDKWTTIAIRLYDQRLSMRIDDKLMHELSIEEIGKRYVCIACTGCIASVRKLRLQVFDNFA